jgi:hypothetical protein
VPTSPGENADESGLMSWLERANSLCAWPLRTLPNFVRNSLSLVELVEVGPLDSGHVEEHVFATPTLDESKTLVRETLNCTFSHCLLFFFFFDAHTRGEAVLRPPTKVSKITYA